MAKGLYTQGMCVLLRKSVSTADIQERLKGFELIGRHESMEDDTAPVTLVYDFRPEVNGRLLVTPANGPWPDDMGDPDESPSDSLPGLSASTDRSLIPDACSVPVNSPGDGSKAAKKSNNIMRMSGC